VQAFVQQEETVYRNVLTDLERKDADLVQLSKQYQQAKAQDYFHSELGEHVREALVKRREANDS
jgi:hypothetical protein